MFPTIKEALRMYKRARRVKKTGFHTYQGTPEEICRQIVEECYDPFHKYYRVSTGHFCEFYVRDFAFSCEALVALGHAKQVRATLEYALATFSAHGRIATMITPDGLPLDFPSYGPDSFALLLYAITHTGNHDLAQEHGVFLTAEAKRFAELVIDHTTGLPRAGKRFSSIRDHAGRKGSCYDAVMIAVAARECQRLHIKFPVTEADTAAHIMDVYWNGTYFFQDLAKQPIVEGDANVFPFWTGIITDPAVREHAITAVQAAALDKPFPLRYVSPYDKKTERVAMHPANLLMPDYETDSVWMHLGLCYLRVLREMGVAHSDSFAQHHDRIGSLIAEHKTFLEVYGTTGHPLRSRWYVTDESMLWCANWLAFGKKDR